MLDSNSPHISSIVQAFTANKLVNLILEQTLIPFHVLNYDLYQKAANVLAELMVGARSEKVRVDAASSLMTQLKPPEMKKVSLEIELKESSEMSDLRESTAALVKQQQEMLSAGSLSALEVATSTIVKKEAEDIIEGEFETH